LRRPSKERGFCQKAGPSASSDTFFTNGELSGLVEHAHVALPRICNLQQQHLRRCAASSALQQRAAPGRSIVQQRPGAALCNTK
jgi:hypothetical protein